MKSLAIVLLLLFIAGCDKALSDRTKPNSPGPTALAAGPGAESTDLPVAANDSQDTDVANTDNRDSIELEAINSDEGHATSTVGSQTEPEPGKPEYELGLRDGSHRLLLPTTVGILIADVEIKIDGQLIQQTFNTRFDQVIENSKGESADATWPDLFKFVAANPTKFGGGGLTVNRPQYRAMQNRYDQNRNSRPDLDEVAKYLFQNSSTSSPFRLFGTDSFRNTNRSKSPTFSALDTDANQVLDEDEISDAATNLRTLDRNSDQRIEFSETTDVASTTGLSNATDPWKRSRSKRWGEVAMDLTGHVDWSMLSYMIGNLNRPGPFGQTSNLMQNIDRDQDKSLNAKEAKELLSVAPDLRLQIVYANGGKGTIKIVSISPQIEPFVNSEQSNTQFRILAESFHLIAQVMPSVYQTNQLPDEAFVTLDANKDGFLNENEIPTQLLREYSFEEFDSDKDGKLTIEEIRIGLAGEEPFWFVQVRARGAESPDAVFDWLDQNHDRFLSTREINNATVRLRDHAIDGSVKPNSIPDTYVVQFGRGDPSQDAQLFSASAARDKTPDTRPRWAQAMDANRDGDITRDEFTGTADQFDSLDTNRDEFVSETEIDPR